ncbi:MAG: hypothetical protein KDN05_11900, partial [Verrucomicrobiae bacterium]|nr:hypothetical protein [Verrucomicrobiae bacterium]
LCDRVVMMTNGPAATIGEILSIDFARPRERTAMMNDPLYYQCLDHLVSFLTERAHLRTTPRIHDSSSLMGFTGRKVETPEDLEKLAAVNS